MQKIQQDCLVIQELQDMRIFDTVYFDKAYTCPLCQGKIYSVQTKAFENMLEGFHVKDCVGHAEDALNQEKLVLWYHDLYRLYFQILIRLKCHHPPVSCSGFTPNNL